MLRIAMTCFERPDVTVRGIAAVLQVLGDLDVRIYLADASRSTRLGSVFEGESRVCWMSIPSDHYWTWGTFTAMAAVYSSFARDGVEPRNQRWLLLNDDVVLDTQARDWLAWFDSLSRASNVLSSGPVSSSKSPRHIIYGPRVKDPNPFRLRFPIANGAGVEEVSADASNGNAMLFTGDLVERIGFVDPRFQHVLADLDYGLRARSAGFTILSPPFAVGSCDPNPVEGRFADRNMRVRDRYRALRHPKGMPPLEWMLFAKRHGHPVLWPLNAVAPVFRVLVDGVLARSGALASGRR